MSQPWVGAVLMFLALVPCLAAQSGSAATSDQPLVWVQTPAFFPRGALIALVSGNPNAAGSLAVQLDMRSGYAAKGRTIISVRTTGPFVMTYVHPRDDPSRPLPLGN